MIGCIIQARMDSTRFPGKILENLDGKNSVFDFLIRQLQSSKFLDKIIIASTTLEHDDIIEKISESHGLDCFRGSENDVLDRYYQCAKKFSVDTIVHVTSDDPLIDPKILDNGIQIFNSKSFDVLTTNQPHTFPYGLGFEIFTLNALEKISKEAKLPSEREHILHFAYANKKDFQIFHYKYKKNMSHIRCSLDYSEDLIFLRKLVSRIKNRPIQLSDILSAVESEPKLVEINNKYKPNEGCLKSSIEDEKFIENNKT